MAYPNLDAELTRFGISREQVAEVIGKTKQTVSARITGNRGDFSMDEAKAINEKFFPQMSMAYLFCKEPITPINASLG